MQGQFSIRIPAYSSQLLTPLYERMDGAIAQFALLGGPFDAMFLIVARSRHLLTFLTDSVCIRASRQGLTECSTCPENTSSSEGADSCDQVD